MGAGEQSHQGRDVDANDKQELKAFFKEELAEHKKGMTELFDLKLGHQASDIEQLKITTETNKEDIRTLKSFKEGHQTWHNDNKETAKFRWEIIVALGSVAVAIVAIFFGG